MKKFLVGALSVVAIGGASVSFATAASWQQLDLNKSFDAEIYSQQNALNRLCNRLSTSNLFRGRLPRFCNVSPQSGTVSTSLAVSSGQVSSGSTVTLLWQSTGGSFCEAKKGWTGNKSQQGSQIVTVATTTTYAITCGNSSASSTAQITVNVTPPAQKLACSDDFDNDGDTRVDYPEDTGCTGSADNDENANVHVSINNSPSPASQNIQPDISNQPLGGFTISITGEPMSVQGMVFSVATGTAPTGLLTNITLRDETNTVYAGPVDTTWQNGIQTIRFNEQVIFQPGTYTFILKGKVPAGAVSGATITLSTDPDSWNSPKSTTSGDAVSLSALSAFSMNTMTAAP